MPITRRAPIAALFAALLAASASTDAQEAASKPVTFECPQFFAGGAAPRIPHDQHLALRPLCYDAYAVLHSGMTKTPVFVAQRLDRAQLERARHQKKEAHFFGDVRIPFEERAQSEDFKGSDFDRGSLAPSADMPTAQAVAQAFSLASVVPQAPVNSRRAWAGIEANTRKYAMRAAASVYVISGPVFDRQPQTIGPGKVSVPRYLYKLVYDPSTGRAWAHWIENTNRARAGRPISYGELVRRTGIEFLPGARLTERR